MKKIILTSLIIITLVLTSCEKVDVSQLSDEDLERISDKLIVCDSPYMRYGSDCCLDTNENSVCDQDEGIEVPEESGTPSQVSAEIRGEIIEKIKTSGELLVFNKIEIDAQIGKPDTFYVGIKNTADESLCFRSSIECVRALGGSCNPTTSREWFNMQDEISIASGDVGVFSVTIQIPSDVGADTYLMKYELAKSNSGDCSNPVWPTSTTLYQSKQFYIRITEKPQEPEESEEPGDIILVEKCTMPAGMACVDFVWDTTDGFTVVIQNSGGFDMSSVVVTLDGTGCVAEVMEYESGTSSTGNNNAMTLTDGETKQYRTNACNALSGKFDGALTISYVNAMTSLAHSKTGELISRTS